MKVTLTRGTLKKFRRTPWRFQQTVARPDADDLDRFVSIITAHGNLESGTVTIDAVVFNTEQLTTLCPTGSTFTHDTSILAQSADEMRALLAVTFGDGPDFICIPTPKPFVFYADHHNWITFYANTKSNLNLVIKPLAAHGYKLVQDWKREL